MRLSDRRRAPWCALPAATALAALLCALPAGAQSGPRVTAQLSTGVAKLGSRVSVEVAVHGVTDARLFDLPRIEGLKLEGIAGPNVSVTQSYTSRGRLVSKSISWDVVLRPEAVGEYVIPPMTLEVDGSELRTNELTLKVVDDLRGKDLGYLELVERPVRVYEGQPFTIDLRLGWDASIGSRVNTANLILPWWGELPATLQLDTQVPTLSSKLIEITLNSRHRVNVLDLGDQELRKRAFRVLQLRRTFVATRPGPLPFPMSYLEFGYVGTGFFDTRKETYHVGYEPFEIEVVPLPAEGRPFDFTGAVGRIEASATVDRRDVDAGDSIKLSVEWRGEGNLEFMVPPDPARLAAFDGFRVYGTAGDRAVGDRRRVVYDLAPVSERVEEIPPLPLVVFDPELGEYTTVATDPIPIRVRPLAKESGLAGEVDAAGPALAFADVHRRPGPSGVRRGPGAAWIGSALVALPFLWIGLRTAVRRRGDPSAPAARRRRAARRRLARELRSAQSAGQQAHAVHRFLAARTGEPEEAWDGRDAPAFVRSMASDEKRVPSPQAVRELTRTLRDLEGRHWAGDDSALEARDLLRLADRLIAEGL